MPNFNQPFDLFNNTKDNFNPYNIFGPTEYIIRRAFPKGVRCQKCPVDPRVVKGCDFAGTDKCGLRIKDKHNPTYIITKGGPDLVTIRSGNLSWLIEHDIPFWVRACRENHTDLHHLDRDPFNNTGKNVALADDHPYFHGVLTSLETTVNNLIELHEQNPNLILQREIKRLRRNFNKVTTFITDSPRIWQIIEINKKFINNELTEQQCFDLLYKLDAADPNPDRDLRVIRKKDLLYI